MMDWIEVKFILIDQSVTRFRKARSLYVGSSSGFLGAHDVADPLDIPRALRRADMPRNA
jgi:hypothetical protein